MRLPQTFDATKYDPTQGFGQMPVGKHPVVISDSEVKATQNNDGGMVVFELTIIDGPAKGQTGPYRLNLYNKSEKAVEIAHRQMSALCHVTGVYNVEDTAALHNIPFVVDVQLQRDKDAASKGYTEVVRVYDINGNEPGKGNAGAGASQGAPAQQGGGNAWGANGGGQQAGNGAGWGQNGGQPSQGQGQPQNSAPPAQQTTGGSPAWGGGAQQPTQQAGNGGGAAPGWGGAPGGPGAKPAWAK